MDSQNTIVVGDFIKQIVASHYLNLPPEFRGNALICRFPFLCWVKKSENTWILQRLGYEKSLLHLAFLFKGIQEGLTFQKKEPFCSHLWGLCFKHHATWQLDTLCPVANLHPAWENLGNNYTGHRAQQPGWAAASHLIRVGKKGVPDLIPTIMDYVSILY